MRHPGLAWLLLGVAWQALAAPADAAFEDPVPMSAATLLPAERLPDAQGRLLDPVSSDGLMRRYELETRYGRFDAYGRPGLEARLRELAALAELERTSDAGVVVDAVGDVLSGSARSVVAVAAHPIDTITGVPRGISHLFRGYQAQAHEIAGAVAPSDDASSREGGAPRSKHPTGSDARRYALRYFGVTAGEREWYRKLGVDPYTDNEPLRRAVHRLARVSATTRFGLKFVALPGLPYAGELGRALDAIYNEDPAVLRARRRTELAGYGLTPAEVHRFENSLLLTPTRQARLDAAAAALAGVDGRGTLFRHALGLVSEHEAEVYVRSVAALAALHAREPFASILGDLRMPAARRADGGVVLCAAFDAVAWTEEVASYDATVRATLPAESIRRELWLAAEPTPRAATKLAASGWVVRILPDGVATTR